MTGAATVNIGTLANDGTGDALRVAFNKTNIAIDAVKYPLATGSTTARALTDRLAESLNVLDFGATNDGVTDCTAAVQAAYDALPDFGGELVFPPGQYCFNLTILKNNVRIRGASCVKDFTTPVPTTYFTPADTDLPLIQVGSDTGYVRGFRMENCTLYGGATTHGEIGVYFAGGAYECHLFEVTIWNFKTLTKFQAGSTYACSKIFITDFNLQCAEVANARCVHAIMPTNQASFTTAIYFSNSNVNGPSSSGSYAAEIDGTFVNFTDVYMDLEDGHGIKFSESNSGTISPYIVCHGLTLDGPTSGTIVETHLNIRQHSWWFRGTCSFDGKMLLPNAELIPPPSGETLIAYQSQANYLQVVGEIALQADTTLTSGYVNEKRVFSDGSLWMVNDGGLVRLKGSTGVKIDPQGGGIELMAGTAAEVVLSSGNLRFDNGKSITFLESDDTTVQTVLTSPDGTNDIALQSVGTLTLSATSNVNVNSAGMILTIGSSHSITILTADVYLSNGRGILFKDSSNVNQYGLHSSGDDILTQPKGNFVVSTTTGAFILPKMTKAQRNALTAINGMAVYQTDSTPGRRYYDEGAWVTAAGVADP